MILFVDFPKSPTCGENQTPKWRIEPSPRRPSQSDSQVKKRRGKICFLTRIVFYCAHYTLLFNCLNVFLILLFTFLCTVSCKDLSDAMFDAM